MYIQKDLFKKLANGEIAFVSLKEFAWKNSNSNHYTHAVSIDSKTHPCTIWDGNAGTTNITIHHELEYSKENMSWMKNGTELETSNPFGA